MINFGPDWIWNNMSTGGSKLLTVIQSILDNTFIILEENSQFERNVGNFCKQLYFPISRKKISPKGGWYT